MHPYIQAALYTEAKKWKQLKFPWTDEWIKMWYMYIMEHYSAIKQNKTMPSEANIDAVRGYHIKWSKSERQILYGITDTQNINMANGEWGRKREKEKEPERK